MTYPNRPLSPPLEVIERQHLGLSDDIIGRALAGDLPANVLKAVKAHPDWPTYGTVPEPSPSEGLPDAVVLPPAVLDAIRRSVKAAKSCFDPAPQVGQIVCIHSFPRHYEERLGAALGAPLYVLLEGPDEGSDPDRLWWGWLCAPEVDYATWWDFVLQEEDEPFSPEVGMVQLWNPVHVPVTLISRVVGQLSPARLTAVRALAGEYLGGEIPKGVPVWPGRVAVREIQGGLTVVTGSPLGGAEDERRRYQQIYFHAAEALRTASRLVLEEAAQAESHSPSLAERLLDQLSDRFPGEFVPEPVVPVAMDQTTEPYQTALHWRNLEVRLYPEGDDLRLVNEGTKTVTVTLKGCGERILDRLQLPPGESQTLELDDSELVAIHLAGGGHQLEISVHQMQKNDQ